MSNKSTGNKFEKEFCQILASHGFWAHNLQSSIKGQPADVLAAINGNTYLIDCKNCSRDVFDTSRIEPNQISSMKLFEKRGNNAGLFAFKFTNGEIYLATLNSLLEAKKRILSKEYIVSIGIDLESWVGEVLCT